MSSKLWAVTVGAIVIRSNTYKYGYSVVARYFGIIVKIVVTVWSRMFAIRIWKQV
jgi:hypothetical protein